MPGTLMYVGLYCMCAWPRTTYVQGELCARLRQPPVVPTTNKSSVFQLYYGENMFLISLSYKYSVLLSRSQLISVSERFGGCTSS